MKRGRRILLWALVGVIVLGGVAWGGFTWRNHIIYGKVVGEDRKTVTVDRGDRFSIAIHDHGASVGDHWTAQVSPADGVVVLGDRKVYSGLLERLGIGPVLLGGGDGTRYFRYDATKPGTVTVTLSNCFQGCHRPSPYSRSVIWTVTIK